MAKAGPPLVLDFPAAGLCIAFVNTALPTAPLLRKPRKPRPRASVKTYDDLVDWGLVAGAVGEDEARRLRAAAGERPAEATAAFEGALKLRDLLLRLFRNRLAGHATAPAEVEALNAYLSSRRIALRTTGKDGFVWSTQGTENSLEAILGQIAGSAARLLVSGQIRFLRQCAGKNCQHFFVDTRNSGRIWCNGLCGGRVRGRRREELVRGRARRRREAEIREIEAIDPELARLEREWDEQMEERRARAPGKNP